MQKKLIIYLHANDSMHPSWAVQEADGMPGQSVRCGEPEQLAQVAMDGEVIVIVPAEDVLLTTAKLPKMNRSRLMQALPFALEEQLIDDVSFLHFAAGNYQPDGTLPIAILTHAKMQQWLATLQSWGIRPDILLPSSLLLPIENQAWYSMLDDMLVVRTGLFQGFAGDKNNIVTLFDLALSSNLEKPERLYVKNYTNHAYASLLEEALGATLKVTEEFVTQEHKLSDLVSQMPSPPAINLLQGNYAVKKSRLPQLGGIWKITGYLAIAWVVLLFLYPTGSYFMLRHKVNATDSQIAQIYKRNFPQSSSVVAPKVRMEEKLQKLTAQIGENRLLSLLGYIGKGMLETSTIKLQRADFQNNQLTLELTAPSSEDFSAFTDFLTQHGLSVKQQSANLAGAHINATLVIE